MSSRKRNYWEIETRYCFALAVDNVLRVWSVFYIFWKRRMNDWVVSAPAVTGDMILRSTPRSTRHPVCCECCELEATGPRPRAHLTCSPETISCHQSSSGCRDLSSGVRHNYQASEIWASADNSVSILDEGCDSLPGALVRHLTFMIHAAPFCAHSNIESNFDTHEESIN